MATKDVILNIDQESHTHTHTRYDKIDYIDFPLLTYVPFVVVFLSSLMTYRRLSMEQELLTNPEDLSSPPFFLSSLMTYLRLCTEQELLNNPEDLSSPPFIYEVRVAQSTVLCVVFWRPLFVLLYFSFGHCIVCPLVLFFWPLYCLALHRQRNKHFNLIVRNCKSLGIKTEYMQRAVVRLVNMISCLAYD
jgi:hypothetical protein